MIILAGKKEEHLNMLEGGIVAKLMEEKWNTFAKMAFVKRLLLLCVQLFCIRYTNWVYNSLSKPSIIKKVEHFLAFQ